GGQPRDVDAVDARDEAEDRLEGAVVFGYDEHERLDDLAQLGTERGSGVVGLIRHRRSLAPGLRPAGAPAGGAVASSAMKAIVLADGDTPDRVGLDLAWPRWAEGVAVVVAADGGARHARDLGLTIDT